MWKRERMMVDVISIQTIKTNAQSAPSSVQQSSPSLLINNSSIPPLQNRQCYPFDSHIHDDINNFYAGNAYTNFGVNSSSGIKRPLSAQDNIPPKRQKQLNAIPPPPPVSTSFPSQQPKNTYTFTSKPYDYMDNIMYY
ncbi:hypothetical protein INT46_002375 [Mucor plumbeus]|uniref:Uncharacterized protein n=1 Tax=Mucor plumbeus TaxID=97098 RepID=A0A8H7QY00_9FUNG|nr:hypothetical protein INT46_002375 [Mucor plumbeus]